ncbi:MAG: 6-carboxyhexanoate--CoA ligase, partial [Deltaproteobacteria bacterium]|nr:6-carboxyhexanoate--CoA ligase [Deltaproteobacteria bacterium]
MRAERGGKHISGAERLLGVDELEQAAVEMLQRAVQHSRGRAEQIFFHVDAVARDQLLTARLLDLHHYQPPDWQQGRELARRMLLSSGISQPAVDRALRDLAA